MHALCCCLGSVQESVKRRLLQQTGLDMTQLNNWFINQRKRHW